MNPASDLGTVPTSGPGPAGIREAWLCASPKAGSGAGRDQIPWLVSLAQSAGITFRVTDSIDELRSRLDQERDWLQRGDPSGLAVIAAGGDGTLALIAGLTPPEIPVVPMPLGTENLLARHFGHSASAEQTFATLTRGTDYQLDAGRVGERLFLVVASAGFDAEVVRAAHLRRDGHIGRFYYAGPIWRAIWRYSFPPIEMEWQLGEGDSRVSGSIECGWGMLFNLPRYASRLTIEPDALGDDGRLDLIAFRRASLRSGFRYVGGVATGRHLAYSDVVRQRIDRVVLRSAGRVPYQLDGDYAGHLPVSIECMPGRVRLRLPPANESRKICP